MESLLASCDRGGVAGRRDFAMMTMMVRLGLRAGALAALGLGDIDWRRGEITVVGKGPRSERLPLPADVGAAVADYLRHARPQGAIDRCVFVRVKAPHRGLTPGGVTHAVIAAGRQAVQRLHKLGDLGAHPGLGHLGQDVRRTRPPTCARCAVNWWVAPTASVHARTSTRPWSVAPSQRLGQLRQEA